MQEGIHPKTQTINAICSCGNKLVIDSIREKDLQLDVCSSCHPFYTGQQKMVDTAGRIKTFKDRYYRRKSTASSGDSAGANDAE